MLTRISALGRISVLALNKHNSSTYENCALFKKLELLAYRHKSHHTNRRAFTIHILLDTHII